MHELDRLHSVTWACWAAAAALTVEIAPNPVYVVLVISLSAIVVEVHGRDRPLARAFPILLLVGATFGAVKVALTVLTVHGVGDTVVTLPEWTLPRLLGGFSVGGTVELEVILQSAAEALVIVGVMAVFGAFNAVVSHDQLVRALPRSFHEAGLIVTVALAFVPSTMATVRSVQESDRARTGGRIVRRGRLVRLALPILATGLEKAIDLASSMDSRGFGRAAGTRGERLAAWFAAGGLVALAAAVVALIGGSAGLGIALVAAGASLIVLAIFIGSSADNRSRYRPRGLTWSDGAVIVASAAAVIILLVFRSSGIGSLSWDPVPLRFPTVEPVTVAAIALLSAPAAAGPYAEALVLPSTSDEVRA
ncbi:MAG: Energy-coupling factor transporter transmembrane protein EcfT [Acidimicrobiales bacterium]|nr:MAG: hypothetical protein EDR02_01365 [Actinomycetota bacterium]MBV6507178.1 Energy-coupling factor transporter transmembrane protein EcfT [Acidimicrobiales bacterium]RIK05530.1 MAG: hypothetical protein DCC48_09565 [Acidobacteriota bacterium]